MPVSLATDEEPDRVFQGVSILIRFESLAFH